MNLSYQVISPAGETVLQAPECCRYTRSIELKLLEGGYAIRLNGKKLTKREIMSRDQKKGV